MPGDQIWERTLAHWQLSITLANMSKFAKSVEHARKAIALFDRDDDFTLGQFHDTLATALSLLGEYEESVKEFEVALAHYRRCEERAKAVLVMRNLAGAYGYFFLNRLEKAEPYLRELLAHFEKQHDSGHPIVTGYQAALAECLLARSAFADAEPLLRGLCKARSSLTENRWLYYNAVSMHGGALTGLGRFDEAEPLVLEGYAKITPPEIREARRTQALERVVTLYEKWGKKDKAAKWRAKLKAAQAKTTKPKK